MTITTKANLAAELNISRARVSQYCRDGLPVRSDGKLDREDALNWIKGQPLNRDGEDKGAGRAAKLVREGRAGQGGASQRTSSGANASDALPPAFASLREVSDPLHAGALLMGLRLTYRLPASAAALALAAGAPLAACYALREAMRLAVLLDVVDECKAFGMPGTGADSFPGVDPDAFDDLDWPALATARGEVADLPAWRASARSLFAGEGPFPAPAAP